MSDWSGKFALAGVTFAWWAFLWWAFLYRPSEPTAEMLRYERRYHETLVCERRYFDPSVLAFEPPTVFRVREPKDFKRAWEHPGPTIITLDMWPACHGDETYREGNTIGKDFEPNGGA